MIHFYTFFYTATMLAMVNATPAMMRRFFNDTLSSLPTTSATGGYDEGGISTSDLFNTSSVMASSISTTITQNVVTSIESTTLTFTLGPKGASSVVTTVVESTLTVTLTSTIYITMTDTMGAQTSPPLEPSAANSGTGATISYAANTPTANSPNDGSNGADPGGRLPASSPGNDVSATRAGPQSANTVEPTVTTTDYFTTTETITLELVETGSAGASGFVGQSDAGVLSQSSVSNPVPSAHDGQNYGCGVTTVTATIVEKSTVTVTPTGTDRFPIAPTATPNYGSSNGTDTFSGYPTASSGFLAHRMHSRSAGL